MKTCSKNQAQVVIQVSISDVNGVEKTNIVTSNVRVYYISGGSEVNVLASVAMVQVGTSNIYRYVWSPSVLNIGEYFIEYEFEDSDGNSVRQSENLVVLNVPTSDDFDIVRKVQTGRWKIINNQMIIYDNDNTTPLLTFDLLDSDGSPTSTQVYERNPV